MEIDLKQPDEVRDISSEPVVGPGLPGHFDDNGVYPGSFIVDADRLLLYYAGRNQGAEPLYYMSIGLAVSLDGGRTFARQSHAPILGRSEIDPWMASTPCVLREEALWRMWYLSGLGWDMTTQPAKSYYDIHYAESVDGRQWQPSSDPAIELRPGESNVARPCVLRDGSGYRMWYSFVAGSGYRIGYAESLDGLRWERKDGEAGIEISPSGWDSESMSYPWVFLHKQRRLMLYCGNHLGKAGFGLAEEA